jgi:CRP-like cAMP-binding protein
VPFFFPIGLRTASTIIAPDGGIEKTVPLSMLRKNAKIELLKRVPLFERCSKSELQEIARLADEIDLPSGQTLTTEGEPGREFFVLIDGKVDVRRKGRKVKELAGGDFLGEIALVADVPRTATVTASTPLRVLVMTARDFRTLMRDVPSLQPKVIYALATRLPPEFQ